MKSFLKLALVLVVFMPILKAQDVRLNGYLTSGKLQDGVAAFSKPANDAERFSLAVLQSLQGLQQFADGGSRLGFSRTLTSTGLPFLRALPRQAADAPVEQATPEKVRQIFQNLRNALKLANTTLAKVGEGEFKVQVNLSRAHLENNDGAPGMPLTESLGRIMGLRTSAEQELVVNFDSADAIWLKGYTHILVGLLDLFLAYDWSPVWAQSAHVLFTSPNPLPPIAKFLNLNQRMGPSEWADLIAGIHELHLVMTDPDGMRKFVTELQAATACSRICWKRIQAESDDDHEWLPSPKQTGPRGSKITQPEVDGWMVVLDEVDAILSGKKLLPHWRLKDGLGINVAKMVQTPPKLDLILIIQGSALVPYIEAGEVSGMDRWRTLVAPYGPGFASFALWSN
ncbi:MAG: hypothetical protein IPP19_11015 [Verrucomicrobia bacterium]|nr:hypothetical protein [Verrucomicrobiota bacterium]